MKVITLRQPWASLIALNLKEFETRSRRTNYRGKLAIHATKRSVKPQEVLAIAQQMDLETGLKVRFGIEYQLGCVVAIADLVDCIEMSSKLISQIPTIELAVGLWEPGRFAWKLDNIKILNPSIPATGHQGL